MLYLGIDIGKNNHEAGLVDEDGAHRGKSLRFSNDQEGFSSLLRFLEQKVGENEDLCVGMEATGHYWLSLYSFLHGQGFRLHVINPLQSDSFRNFHIRQVKTDSVDCFLIADVIRFGKFSETRLADEDVLVLRNLARFRESLKDSCSDYKRQVVTVLDQVFPEYDSLFSNVFGEGSKAFLKTCGTPEQALDLDTKSLAALLRKASRGRHGAEKADEIKSLAGRSVGMTLCKDAFAFQLKILIEQIEFTEKQIGEIDKKLAQLLKKLNPVILSIPGVGPATVRATASIARAPFDTTARNGANAGRGAARSSHSRPIAACRSAALSTRVPSRSNSTSGGSCRVPVLMPRLRPACARRRDSSPRCRGTARHGRSTACSAGR